MTQERKGIQLTTMRLLALVVGMFIFAVWIMPPMYDLFCEITGLNGKTKGRYEPVSAEVDTSRTVEVQFVAINNNSMPWDFAPKDFSVNVHPGQAFTTHFIARNPTQAIMVGQAVPSLAPKNATDYFHKTECFCFNKQILEPGEQAELGLQFIVDQALPRKVSTITLSYSLFDVTDMSQKDVNERALDIGAQNNNHTLTIAAQSD